MNQKTAKQLRQIAKKLPDVWVIKNAVQMVQGKHLTKRQRELIAGKVQLEKMYKVDKEVTAKEDHYKKVFAVYERQGEAGLTKYVASVHIIHKKQQADLKNNPHRHPEILSSLRAKRSNLKFHLRKFFTWLKNIFLFKEKLPNTINS
jgi:uncharacterized membrane protein YgaE (UPF0421/DUF939 family)